MAKSSQRQITAAQALNFVFKLCRAIKIKITGNLKNMNNKLLEDKQEAENIQEKMEKYK